MTRPPLPGDGPIALPPGDQQALRAAAARLRAVAAASDRMGRLATGAAEELALVWEGADARRASAEALLVTARAGSLAPGLAAAAGALDTYATSLEHAQGMVAALARRADSARAEHARAVAIARAGTDASACRALEARARLRLDEQLHGIRRDHGAALEELSAAAVRAAHVLDAVTHSVPGAGSGCAPGARAAMLQGLPFVHERVVAAQRPRFGFTTVRDERWWETAGGAVAATATDAYDGAVVPVVNGSASVLQAMAQNPGDVVEMAAGAAMTVVGAGGEIAGFGLDMTGVGAVAGMPVNVAAAGLMTAGAVTTAHGATQLGAHAAENGVTLLQEASGPAPSRGSPGDPLPDTLRPDTAGPTWKGRVADSGKGDVWQDPSKVEHVPGQPRNASSLRIMDPEGRYPYGYVRFYNDSGQALTPEGKPGPQTSPTTHFPIRPDGTYDLPKGWSP